MARFKVPSGRTKAIYLLYFVLGVCAAAIPAAVIVAYVSWIQEPLDHQDLRQLARLATVLKEGPPASPTAHGKIMRAALQNQLVMAVFPDRRLRSGAGVRLVESDGHSDLLLDRVGTETCTTIIRKRFNPVPGGAREVWIDGVAHPMNGVSPDLCGTGTVGGLRVGWRIK